MMSLDLSPRLAGLVFLIVTCVGCSFDSSGLARFGDEADGDVGGADAHGGGDVSRDGAAARDVDQHDDVPIDGESPTDMGDALTDVIADLEDEGPMDAAGDSASDAAGDSAPDVAEDLPAAEPRIPEGSVAFFSGGPCPVGWTPVEGVEGLALVGTDDGLEVGRRVGQGRAFGAQHNHDFEATVEVSGAGIAALSTCCNDAPGKAGSYTLSGPTAIAHNGLPLVADNLCVYGSARGDAQDHPFPDGTIMYFAREACPSGWSVVEEAAGRVVVGTREDGASGQQVGTPLEPGELPTHTHSLEGSITLSERSLMALDGSNRDLAAKGIYSISSVTESAPGGLPYVEFLVCRADIRPIPPEMPPGDRVPPRTLAWFDSTICPQGWSAAASHRGRIPVVADSEYPAGTTSSDPLLEPGEDRTHVHAFAGSVEVPAQSVGVANGCCNRRAGNKDTFTISGDTSAASSGMPTIAYLACVRD